MPMGISAGLLLFFPRVRPRCLTDAVLATRGSSSGIGSAGIDGWVAVAFALAFALRLPVAGAGVGTNGSSSGIRSAGTDGWDAAVP